MRVAGIAVTIPTPKRPSVRVVVLDDASGAPVIEVAQDIPSAAVDVVAQLRHVSMTVESRLRSLQVDRVVVRRADFSKRQGNTEGPRLRLLVEGAATAAARAAIDDTRLGTGKDVAQWCSTFKDDLDDEAAKLVAAASEHAKFVEAAAAALGGLKI